MNAIEIEEAISQLADQPFDPESFPYAFLEAFGNKETTIKRLRAGASKVETRIANAHLDPTFLLADVEVIATCVLYNISRVKLENLIHRVFDPAQLDIEIRDRFGNPVRPREWFLVPLFVVNEVVERIRDGTITQFVNDPTAARLVKTAT